MRALLSYESMACLLSMCLPLSGGLSGLCCTFCCSFLISCGVDKSLDLHFCTSFFLWAGSCLGIGPSSFSSAPVSLFFWFVGRLTFPPHHFIASAVLPLNLCLLGFFWACHAPFSYSIQVAQCFCWVNPHTILGFLDPFHSFRHSRPTLFLWASLAHSILTFPWVFATSFGLLWPNCRILYFRGFLAFAPISLTNSFLWAPPTHFYLLSISYNSHGLTTSFFGLPWARLLSLGPFYYSIGSWTIIPTIQV